MSHYTPATKSNGTRFPIWLAIASMNWPGMPDDSTSLEIWRLLWSQDHTPLEAIIRFNHTNMPVHLALYNI